MNRGLAVMGGLGLGAGLMYLLDPDRGHARRTRIRDRAAHAEHIVQRKVRHALIDARNRTQGAVVETIDRLADLPVPDSIVMERVRAKLGHLVEHPHDVRVSAKDGVVTLEGTIPAAARHPLMRGVRSVRGVMRVEDKLEAVGIDEQASTCGNVANWAGKAGVALGALSVLGAAGAILFFRMRETEQVVAFPGLTEVLPPEFMPESAETTAGWAGEALVGM